MAFSVGEPVSSAAPPSCIKRRYGWNFVEHGKLAIDKWVLWMILNNPLRLPPGGCTVQVSCCPACSGCNLIVSDLKLVMSLIPPSFILLKKLCLKLMQFSFNLYSWQIVRSFVMETEFIILWSMESNIEFSKTISRIKGKLFYTSGKNTVPVVFCAIPSIISDAALSDIWLISSQGSNFVPVKYDSTTVI